MQSGQEVRLSNTVHIRHYITAKQKLTDIFSDYFMMFQKVCYVKHLHYIKRFYLVQLLNLPQFNREFISTLKSTKIEGSGLVRQPLRFLINC